MKTSLHLVLFMLVSSAAFGRSTTHGSAENEIRMFSGALETFRLEYGRYPNQSEGLIALVTRPADVAESKWRPYFTQLHGTDPWGHDYVYRFPGIHNKGSFDLFSLGEDGVSKSGGVDADDINSWDAARTWSRHYTGRLTPLGRFIIWGIGCFGLAGLALLAWRSLGTPKQTIHGAAA